MHGPRGWESPSYHVLLVYINDLTDNFNCCTNPFADDTSLFSVIRDEVKTALELTKDLESVSLMAWQ